MQRNRIYQICYIALLAALVFVSLNIQIEVPLGVAHTRFHLGNIMCLLAGFLLGPIGGGLAAGIGAFFFDLSNPLYSSTAFITFIFRFAMAAVCGLIAYSGGAKGKRMGRNIIAAVCGSLTYIALYMIQTFINNYFFAGQPLDTVFVLMLQKCLVSLVNAVIACVVSVPLASAIRIALEKAGVYNKLTNR